VNYSLKYIKKKVHICLDYLQTSFFFFSFYIFNAICEFSIEIMWFQKFVMHFHTQPVLFHQIKGLMSTN